MVMSEMDGMAAAFGDLQAQMAALRASEVREPVSAVDPSGSVTASLGPSGELIGLEVDRQWKTAVRPDRLGAACAAAIDAAVDRRRELWAENAERERAKAASAASFGRAVTWAEAPATPTRDLGDLMGFMDFDPTRQLVDPEVPTTRSPEGVVTLTGTAEGRIEVTVDPKWASQVSAAEINAALAHAVTAMGPEFAAPPDPFAGYKAYNSELDSAFADALAHLNRMGKDL